MAAFSIAPSAATPTAPPSEREKFARLVAIPRCP
jgi:hypothetical protein